MQGFDISNAKLQKIVQDTLVGKEDGELFIEESEHEILVFENSRLRTADFKKKQGFGLRVILGEACGYACSSQLTEKAILQAKNSLSFVQSNYSGTIQILEDHTPKNLYQPINPINTPLFSEKVTLLEEIDAWIRQKDPNIKQVSIFLASSTQNIHILRPEGLMLKDQRPLVRINISVIVGQNQKQETGSSGIGGRTSFEEFLAPNVWQSLASEALRQALVNLSATPSPAGTFDVVLGCGWPGVMLHEAVGHGLEADFNRKKTSAFTGLIGQQVAAKEINIVDDGSIPKKRGSIHIDDEGTPSQRTVLIEKGKLVGYMQDRQNARLMSTKPTGNGRRESYHFQPMPRMTNTFMLNGDYTPEEIISSVKRGIYAVSFGGGQVDITSGKFVFGCTESYMIEDGKITQPLKGAMLIGEGPKAMQRITMVGNDTKLDGGVGTCGKNGQNVPVGVGQPHLRMNDITIGGTAL